MRSSSSGARGVCSLERDLSSWAVPERCPLRLLPRRSWSPSLKSEAGSQLRIAEAVDGVIVHHAGRLHVRIADGRADEPEAPLLEVGAHALRLGRLGGDLGHGPPFVLDGLARLRIPKRRRRSCRTPPARARTPGRSRWPTRSSGGSGRSRGRRAGARRRRARRRRRPPGRSRRRRGGSPPACGGWSASSARPGRPRARGTRRAAGRRATGTPHSSS